MKSLALTYGATLLTLAILDLSYLSTIGIRLFKRQLGPGVLRERPVALAALLFYVMYCAGLVHFAVLPNAGKDLGPLAIEGLWVGLFAYGTYDLTNMATLEKWTWTLVIADMIWGGVVTALASAAGGYVSLQMG